MSSAIWPPSKNNKTNGKPKANNPCKGFKPVVLKEVQLVNQKILQKYDSITKTTKPFKLPKRKIEKITESGKLKSM